MRTRFVLLWAMLVTVLYFAASRLQRQTPPAPEAPPAAGAPSVMPVQEMPAPIEVRNAPARRDDHRVADFRKAAREALASLPRVEKIRQRTEAESHHPPPELVSSGEAIGRLLDRMEADPSLVAEGLSFFDECARDASAVTASRAVCLLYLRHWAPRAKGYALNESRYPDEVGRLADKLPGLAE